MRLTDWLAVAGGASCAPVSALGIHLLLRGPAGAFFMAWLGAAVWSAVLARLLGDAHYATGYAISAGACLVTWWLWRRRRRWGVLKLAGYKARAALAKLAKRAREAAQPRPVLRPVPGSAG